MRLLLDTHVAVWAIDDSRRLSQRARELIAAPAHQIVISAVSVWEISIKHVLGRGPPTGINFSGAEAICYFREAGYEFLPVTPDHAALVGDLPPLHADPFDRLLIAQALHEPLKLVTHDRGVAAYSNHFLLV